MMTCLKYFFTSIVFFFSCSITESQTGAEKGLEAISESAVKGQLEFLASDWTEVRGMGTRGAYMCSSAKFCCQSKIDR